MTPQEESLLAVPRTPKKPNQSDPVREVIDKLNRDYNVSIKVPDVTLTPSATRERAQQDAAFARSEEIVRQLRYHCFHPTLLDRILYSFHLEARAASQKWIRLYDGDGDDDAVVPDPTAPPRAESSGQVLEFQEIFISILNQARPRQPKFRTFTRAHTGPAAYASADMSMSKRRPEVDTEVNLTKKVKGNLMDSKGSGQRVSDALDFVPIRSRSVISEPSAAKFSRDVREPLRSKTACSVRESVYGNTSFSTAASTSRASLFSVVDGCLPGTQETIPAPIEEELASCLPPAREPTSFVEHDLETSSKAVRKPTEPAAPIPLASSPGATGNSEISAFDDPIFCKLQKPLARQSEPNNLLSRLEASWPRFPCWLNRAPFAVAWEATRIAVHCGVDLGEVVDMTYAEKWINYNELRKSLLAHPLFAGKSFPERPEPEAWAAAMAGFKTVRGQHVVFSASLGQVSRAKKGPIFTLSMSPVSLDQGCRLHRRFGSDRFLELLVPSPNSWEAPIDTREASQQTILWLSSKLHYLAGRKWRAFFSRDAGYKMPQKGLNLRQEPKPVFRERVSLFAEDGNSFHPTSPRGTLLSSDNLRELRVKCRVSEMLDWLLQFDQNQKQPYLKLFSRIQLGLSKTMPVIVLELSQIRNRGKDLRSPIDMVMNDGIGRMSRSLARKVRDVLGLSDVPSAIQGRFGPAKGMWLTDISEEDGKLWLETWPSQRKWDSDFKDPEHRTLEVRSHAMDTKSASLNLQFLPVMEDRAIDKDLMRETIGKNLVDELNREIEEQKNAMKYSLLFRQYVNKGASTRKQRLTNGRIPFLGGLPDSSEERMNFLIDGGFEPQSQKYLQDLSWSLRRAHCDKLLKKMSIKVPESAYLFMVIDFWNVLEEGEVHLCFSSKFQTDTFSDSMLHGCDVLVARSPAHFVSDVQRVKAVFKPELHAIKDVIVFSAKGNVPLADKLSGGDYDGDKAWVCWDPAIVLNFKNAETPASPSLERYLRKDKTTFADLVVPSRGKPDAVSDMVNRGIAFSMRPSYLGSITNFKERLCYHLNSVNNEYALKLSALLSNLVDQAKQGIEFTGDDWKAFCREQLDSHMSSGLEEPAYKSDSWSCSGKPAHIVDYLKFSVAKPTVEAELQKLHKAMNSRSLGRSGHSLGLHSLKDNDEEAKAEYWDADLAKPHEIVRELATTNPELKKILENLMNDLRDLERKWSTAMATDKEKDNAEVRHRILEVYESWRNIQPRLNSDSDEPLDPMVKALLLQPYLGDDFTQWALLRASMLFKQCYKHKPAFVWRMAGIQLQYIKSMTMADRDSVPVAVVPSMYAALKPDSKYIMQAVSRMTEEGSEYPVLESDGENDWQDWEGDE
ncbi:RNA-directed RNA polymerase [Colletotrichum higginsianum]|uniref:RNA-dependent RNA polymerase n=1 Tax=Colletotrichum higginsianum (strain IMI 349063) TaxID=759273 RepID=H1V9I1_COLHI|nr:RNA-directed RNA polymerase [Colletotrichum higginsianum IMI 349063]OBR11111.1 RNA-directed RNA polymerase [Colletotrichum higginsianum IMI 349063]CCF36884.1 RNA-directed RNA polymerase [Colletotrichum higginsianum]